LDPEVISQDKKWSRNNSPKIAIDKYFFEFLDYSTLDEDLNSLNLPGAAFGGFLRKV
jgi:hypothetical protein